MLIANFFSDWYRKQMKLFWFRCYFYAASRLFSSPYSYSARNWIFFHCYSTYHIIYILFARIICAIVNTMFSILLCESHMETFKVHYEYGNGNMTFWTWIERPNALKLQIHSENQIRLPSICVDNNQRTRKRFFKCDCQQNML